MNWPVVTKECRPWIYWYWMGSAVDEPNLTQHLETHRNTAGTGGVHIIPIYGVHGFEDQFIDYLSSQWMDMLEYTVTEANRVGMGVDMSTGTGWPFGGPQVSAEDASAKVNWNIYTLYGGESLSEQLQKDTLQVLMAYSDGGDILDLTDKVDGNGNLDWIAPPGEWKLYAVYHVVTGQQVKRAAPGGEGNVVDPFSCTALQSYLDRFDVAFAGYQGDPPRAHYHDSYEYYGADWTDDLFEQFTSRRAYDLREQLPALFGNGSTGRVARVKCDYRETMSDLHLEYIRHWVEWCHEKGSLTRNQAHGAPGNLLDLYAASDIPEIETFGSSRFEIPGLRVDPDGPTPPPDPLMLKFASSAAHVTGKNLVASESCTWLGEHFKVSLSQVKPEIDQLLCSGVNHVFFTWIYSPFGEQWPGWIGYWAPAWFISNPFCRDMPDLHAYVARCQSFLQSGHPDNDILLYWPIHDLWHDKGGMLGGFSVHGMSGWLCGSQFYKSAKTMWVRGYTFDYVSDRILADVQNSLGELQSGGEKYRVLVVPKCNLMPLSSLEKLIDLAQGGATIIVQENLPGDVPGFGNLSNRRDLFEQALAALEFLETGYPGISKATIGNGQFFLGDNLEEMLEINSITREQIVDTTGIQFIRRTHPQGHHYFISNLGKEDLDGWVRLGVEAKSVVIFDPRFYKQGLAAVCEGEDGLPRVYLQLPPGESCILRTFSSLEIEGPKWRYLHTSGQPHELKGTWHVTFIEGGPNLPAAFETRTLASWTELGGTEAEVFSGMALYSITFDKPAGNVDDWVLDLGRVCESACVRINGQRVGVLWSIPFQIPIGEFLSEGKNVLEVEVTNLGANRIADMDRRGVYWKKFYDINFVNIKYQPFDASDWPPMDSGLLGPVRLIPSMLIRDSEIDCVVDFKDFAVLADNWLETGIWP